MPKELTKVIADLYNDPVVAQQLCPYTGKIFPIHQSYKELLEKISPTIAGKKYTYNLPVISPAVRERMRTMFRNERKYTNNVSEISGKKVVSLYHPGQAPVVTIPEWWEDSNDPMIYNQEPKDEDAFSTLKKINDIIPRPNLMTASNVNCDYTSGTGYCKDCYLICASEYAEKCMYSKLLQKVENTIDSLNIFQSEWLYQCINCKKCSKSVYLKNSNNCHDCRFSDQLTSCSNCLLCTGLVNKQYHYKNKPISKEAYEEKMQQIRGSYIGFETYLKAFKQLQKITVVKYADITNGENVIGNNIFDSKGCQFCFNCNECEDCAYLTVGETCKQVIDSNNMYVNIEKNYNTLGTITTFDVHSCLYVFRSQQMYYCQDCYDCNNCFGCFGLRGKEYCLYNTQYTKSEWEEKVTNIIEAMVNNETRGLFFPSTFSQFPYNDTVAMEYYPIHKIIDLNGKERIVNTGGEGTVRLLEHGFIVDAELDLGGEKKLPIQWRIGENEINIPSNADLIHTKDLPDTIQAVDLDISSKVIICETSGRPFRILPQELAFYQKVGIPLPRKHQDIRYEERLAMLQPRTLYARPCDKTGETIISVYPEKDTRKVYSEKAYEQEIYG